MKVVLYMAISANGMIARLDDETEWSDEESESYIKKVKECRNMIIGRKTYELMLEDDNKDANIGNLGNPLVVVVTKSPNKYKSKEKLVFVSSPKEALKILEDEGYETAMVAGGSLLCSSFVKEKLVDEVYLDIEPVIFVEGIPLFRDSFFEYALDLVEVKNLSRNSIQLQYSLRK